MGTTRRNSCLPRLQTEPEAYRKRIRVKEFVEIVSNLSNEEEKAKEKLIDFGALARRVQEVEEKNKDLHSRIKRIGELEAFVAVYAEDAGAIDRLKRDNEDLRSKLEMYRQQNGGLGPESVSGESSPASSSSSVQEVSIFNLNRRSVVNSLFIGCSTYFACGTCCATTAEPPGTRGCAQSYTNDSHCGFTSIASSTTTNTSTTNSTTTATSDSNYSSQRSLSTAQKRAFRAGS